MSEKRPNERAVATDALATLGKIHERTERRDAIHLAVEPVEAGERLQPGEHIKVVDGIATTAEPEECLGIVDPFLIKTVKIGERFWFVMYPRVVHSLRHVWSHPSFPDEELAGDTDDQDDARNRTAQARAWIRMHAAELGVTYQRLMQMATEWLESGEVFTEIGSEHMRDTLRVEEFWTNYECMTGVKVDPDRRYSFIGCSC